MKTTQFASPTIKVKGPLMSEIEGYYVILTNRVVDPTDEEIAQEVGREAINAIKDMQTRYTSVQLKELHVETGYYLFGLSGGIIDGPHEEPPDSSYVYAAHFVGKCEAGV